MAVAHSTGTCVRSVPSATRDGISPSAHAETHRKAGTAWTRGPLSPADLRVIVGALMSTSDPLAATKRLIELMYQEQAKKLATSCTSS